MPRRADMRFISYVPVLVRQGFSGRAAAALLRQHGFHFANERFWEVWRSEAGYEKGKWRATRQPEDIIPPEDLFQPSERYVVSRYTYRFLAIKRDPDTGELREGAVHLGTDEKITIRQAREILESAIEERPQDYREVVEVGAFGGAFYSTV